VALAVIDDRLYRRFDLDQLGIAVLAVIPPAKLLKRRRAPPARRSRNTRGPGPTSGNVPDLGNAPGRQAPRPSSQAGGLPGQAGPGGPAGKKGTA
jgi:hypothetical protein